MRVIKYTLYIMLLINLIGCSEEPSVLNMFSGASFEAKQRKKADYLAYEHSVTVNLAKTEIRRAFSKITDYCTDDRVSQCTMLHSSLSTGDYSSSHIRLRIMPNGVEPLLDLVSKQGDISNRSTDVEDLQDAIVNGAKRLEMLNQYQSHLISLEKKSSDDIESLIKIAEELAKVQSDIEYAEGEKAKLLLRTQMDIVNISLRPLAYTSFWQPISDSLASFGENLSEGISRTIIAVAYLLPWIIIILPLGYVLRIAWRRMKAKEKQ